MVQVLGVELLAQPSAEHHRELQPLGAVNGHHRHTARPHRVTLGAVHLPPLGQRVQTAHQCSQPLIAQAAGQVEEVQYLPAAHLTAGHGPGQGQIARVGQDLIQQSVHR